MREVTAPVTGPRKTDTLIWKVAPPCGAPGVTRETLGELRVTGEPARKTLGDRGLCRLQPDPSLG